jgi:peptide/nickel transport system permease protein
MSISHYLDFWRKFRKNRFALCAAFVLAVIILLGILGPIVSPYDPHSVGLDKAYAPLSKQFIMGTDNLGRDVLSRFLWGARVSLFVGISAAAAASLMGVLVGTFAGYLGGLVDNVLMRIAEFFMVIPRFFLALLFVALFGANIWNIIFAIGILSWPQPARIIRSEFLSQRKRYFVDAAIMQGSSTLHIIFIEILPNVMGVIVVNCTLMVGQAMLLEAGLSYLGVGDPSTVSWGTMLYAAQKALNNAWWMSVFPGLGIFLSVLSLNIVGDGLNDVLNPRSEDSKGALL